MNFSHDFHELRTAFLDPKNKECRGIIIDSFSFRSKAASFLPGQVDYYCQYHDKHFLRDPDFLKRINAGNQRVNIKDSEVKENQDFEYQVIRPANGEARYKRAIFLLHGFNEKDWDKYLLWAKYLSEYTNSLVVLFPIAFHMQRAPSQWSERRRMYHLSEERKVKYPDVVNSTLSNVAISARLSTIPQRFIWSGLQTYYDIIQLITEVKNGKHPLIDSIANFDFFAYSIGGFLAQILKLSNHNGYFSNSKVCLFCSGAIFNRFSPVSKYILDSEASVALYSFLVEHLDRIIQKDEMLDHFIRKDHFEGKVFYSMLHYHKFRDFRENLLRKNANDFYAVALRKDEVIPSLEIVNGLQGAQGDIPIKVDELDFDRDYIHENPFPANSKDDEMIGRDFEKVFQKVTEFFINS